MAGLAGWVAPARRAADERLLVAMAQALAHRLTAGEALSVLVDANERRQVVLGVTAVEPASGIALALDGTRVHGAEAAESLLRAYERWGKDVVKQLSGAFAFALWDPRRERLLLGRDRFGEKPLYLHERDGALYFASEPKALLQAGAPARLDEAALRQTLAGGRPCGTRTLFAGIRKLTPGSVAVWQFGKLQETRYWSPPDGEAVREKSRMAHAEETFASMLCDAVKSSGASAVLLSGGLDSAMLAAAASANGAALRTYSFALEGEKDTELAAARALAQHFGTRHEEVIASPRTLAAALPEAVAARDAPLARPSDLAVHYLAAAARGGGCVMTGEGADEVLGGYRRYLLPPHNRLRRRLYADQTGALPDVLLERTERAAAAAGLQAVQPYLDHRLAEYVSTLPDAARVRGLTTKRILRRAAERLLPPALRKRAKRGYLLDVGGWLRNDLRELMLDHLQPKSCVTRELYDAAALDRALQEHLRGKKNHESLLWTLLNIEIWHRTYAPG